MNYRKVIQWLAVIGLSVLALTAINVWAGDDKPIPSEVVAAPPETGGGGYFVFTGARTSPQVATVVHCTNPTQTLIEINVILFHWDNTFGYAADMIVPSGHTRTVAFDQDGTGTGIFFEDYIVDTVLGIGQGYGKIIPDPANASFYCTAQLVDKNSSIPNFMVDLPIIPVDSNGIPIPTGNLRNNFLPSVLRD
jgi:hypothetical protein